MSEGVHFSLFRGDSNGTSGPPTREFQELWFSLAKRRWSSLVLVPADEESSTAQLAASLADIGGRLRDSPVTMINVEKTDFESARMLADLQLRVQEDFGSVGETVPVEATIASPPVDAGAPAPAAPPDAPQSRTLRTARPVSPAGQIIVAIQPVVVEPLGVAIAQAADAVVLCVRLGVTRRESARRTIELIGRERVVGALVVR